MKHLALCVAFTLTSATALAVDNGQYNNVPDGVRAWFKSVKSPNGVPCCDIADGHGTDWEHRADGYYVPDPNTPCEGDSWVNPTKCEWVKVPDAAVVVDTKNPTGGAVVWYSTVHPLYIRCFVPGIEG